MEGKYLPIGSVVLLEGGTKRLMITGYCMQTAEQPGVLYDYSGCLYPEGLIRSDITSIFNHDQIKEIFFKGFDDAEGQDFRSSIVEDMEELEDDEDSQDYKFIDSSVTAPQKIDSDDEYTGLEDIDKI